MGKVGITRTSLLRQKEPHVRLSFLFNFIISCHLLIPSLLTHLFHCLPPPRLCHHCWWRRGGKRAANLIKVIGMTDATCVIRSPGNYLQHRPGYTEQDGCGAFLQEPRGGTQKLTTNQTFHPVPQQSNLCGETHALFIFSPRQRWGNIAEREARQLPGVGRRGQKGGRFSQFVLLSKQCPQNQ